MVSLKYPVLHPVESIPLCNGLLIERDPNLLSLLQVTCGLWKGLEGDQRDVEGMLNLSGVHSLMSNIVRGSSLLFMIYACWEAYEI